MCHISTSTTTQNTNALQIVYSFFNSFTITEALKLQHKMTRAAFAHERNLDKQDVLDLLFMKEELTTLIKAAALLKPNNGMGKQLKKLFAHMPAGDWIEWLDELFHAAVYDGFYTIPSSNPDVYYCCRGLLKIIKGCHELYVVETLADETAPAPVSAGNDAQAA